jgi:inward rectifier potassium channel
VAEAQLRVILMTIERTAEGETMRRATDLRLVRDTTALFVLTWTVMHEIDASSPFHGPGAIDALRAAEGEFFLSFSGVDETLAANIHGRHRYKLDDIAVGSRFADVVATLPDGRRQLDYSAFHDIVPETE